MRLPLSTRAKAFRIGRPSLAGSLPAKQVIRLGERSLLMAPGQRRSYAVPNRDSVAKQRMNSVAAGL
jgi:hypothetical protein